MNQGKLLYLQTRAETVAVRSGGEIPSRESAVGAGLAIRAGTWTDSPADSAYAMSTTSNYHELDRFHYRT